MMKDGYPCLFYGDYYGVKGEKSPHTKIIDILLNARKSMHMVIKLIISTIHQP